MVIEARLRALGLELPMQTADARDYYGQKYGKMKPHYRAGNVRFLSGHTAGMRDGAVLYPGLLRRDLSIEDGYQAARLAGPHCWPGSRMRSATSTASRASLALFAEVFGEAIGVGPRATIGVTSLADNYCFETWMTVEVG